MCQLYRTNGKLVGVLNDVVQYKHIVVVTMAGMAVFMQQNPALTWEPEDTILVMPVGPFQCSDAVGWAIVRAQ